jgi:tRNA pseudouridine38-40 synthase
VEQAIKECKGNLFYFVSFLFDNLFYRNPNAKTIELDLFEGLCRAGLVSDENAVDPKKIGWMRSCRTDKGVHAAGQVVSFKMLMKYDSDADKANIPLVIEELNDVLQNQMGIGKKMEIFGIIKTASSFHAKDRADSRYYEYLLPTFVFARQSREEFIKLAEASSVRTDVGGQPGKIPLKSKGSSSDSDGEDVEEEEVSKVIRIDLSPEELKRISEYRVSGDDLDHFNRVLAHYCGTHNFHNFTIGKGPNDPSAQRHIKTFAAAHPFVVKSENESEASLEWVTVRVHGMSFMMHQIRKMIGLAILAVRLDSYEPEHLNALFDRLFSNKTKVNVPKAPALGLFLDHPLFEGYNRKFGKEENRELMDFEPMEERRTAFKNAIIYPEIFSGEFKTREFYNWLKCIDDHAYDFKYILE